MYNVTVELMSLYISNRDFFVFQLHSIQKCQHSELQLTLGMQWWNSCMSFCSKREMCNIHCNLCWQFFKTIRLKPATPLGGLIYRYNLFFYRFPWNIIFCGIVQSRAVQTVARVWKWPSEHVKDYTRKNIRIC